jgi:hypothetical protein
VRSGLPVLAGAAASAAALVAVGCSGGHAPAAYSGALPAGIQRASVRLPAGQAPPGGWWTAHRDSGADCLLRGDARRLRIAACGSLSRGLVSATRRDGSGTDLAGIVPRGIDAVTVGRRTVRVRDGLFTLRLAGRPPRYVVLQGPAAPGITPARSVAVVTREGSPPVVAVTLRPEPFPGLPEPVRGTVAQAAAAMRFPVWAPDPPPLTGRIRVEWSPRDPRVFPQVTISYLPARRGSGISLIEGAHRGRSGARPYERVVRRGGRTWLLAGDARTVRVTRGGTDVQISGGTLDELIAAGASLRRVPTP